MLIEKEGELNYRFLANMWTILLFNRGCDICKEFKIEIAVIHSRFQQFGSDDFMFVFSVSSDAVEVSNDGSFFFQVSLNSSKPR